MKKEEFKNELKRKILLNSFWNEKEKLILLELKEDESLNDIIEEFIKDLETIYNIEKVEFISVKVLEVEKIKKSIFHKISYEITLHFDINVISLMKTEKINVYAYENEINFIE